MEKFRQGLEPEEFAHEPRAKKTVRGYVTSVTLLLLARCRKKSVSDLFVQMGPKGPERQAHSVETHQGQDEEVQTVLIVPWSIVKPASIILHLLILPLWSLAKMFSGTEALAPQRSIVSEWARSNISMILGIPIHRWLWTECSIDYRQLGSR